ncbi:MAG: maleylpyruvate isomerase N-terminal domain-containing protein [Chloroflexi bacterium]|nr:maleylpyruvate isomerase N-terminal domain-containing protein [Chloroflexota bacterium]
MTDQPAVSKSQLLANLRSSGEELLSKLEGLPAGALEAGCYENGWNGRQVLAHIAAIEWTYPRLIDIARNGPPEKKPGAGATSKPAKGGINSYNDRQIERYADATAAELLDVFRKNRETTISAIEATEDELFATEVKSAGGVKGPLGTVLNFVAVMHVNVHVNDVLDSAARAQASG